MLRRAVIFFCLFTLFLLYLVFSCGWYEPAVLVIKGRVLDTGAVIGSGFRFYYYFVLPVRPHQFGLKIGLFFDILWQVKVCSRLLKLNIMQYQL